eukprot:GHVU01034813.1.p1 GENE.GHVU01034813.1~~GHVU01034813.1.p1  ORF type:complete len:247 (-),score=25.63 GHVU01034813.1:964-1704(-)
MQTVQSHRGLQSQGASQSSLLPPLHTLPKAACFLPRMLLLQASCPSPACPSSLPKYALHKGPHMEHTADIYSRVWTTEGSPLLSTTKKLAVNLQKRVDEEFKGANVEILPCMRYGAPSVQNVLLNFLQKSSPLEQRRVLVLPLYPQNTEATIASTYDAVFNVLSSAREMPELRFSNGYYADPAYIAAIATSINNFWQENGKGDKLLISFHGLPEDSIQKGDNYYFQCAETCKRIKDELKVQVRHPV